MIITGKTKKYNVTFRGVNRHLAVPIIKEKKRLPIIGIEYWSKVAEGWPRYRGMAEKAEISEIKKWFEVSVHNYELSQA